MSAHPLFCSFAANPPEGHGLREPVKVSLYVRENVRMEVKMKCCERYALNDYGKRLAVKKEERKKRRCPLYIC